MLSKEKILAKIADLTERLEYYSTYKSYDGEQRKKLASRKFDARQRLKKWKKKLGEPTVGRTIKEQDKYLARLKRRAYRMGIRPKVHYFNRQALPFATSASTLGDILTIYCMVPSNKHDPLVIKFNKLINQRDELEYEFIDKEHLLCRCKIERQRVIDYKTINEAPNLSLIHI